MVTPGSVADASWNAGAYEGLMWVRDSLGAQVSHVEARTPGEQEEALRAYAAQGYDLIFAHGFEFQDMAERVGAEFPEATFVITSGRRVVGRVVPIVFKLSEGAYLAGVVAGFATKSNRIGFVGGMELPPVRLAAQAWEDGARSVNPAIESRVVYLNNFDDAVMGREASLALIQHGVDMLHHNADAAGLGVFQAAKDTPGVLVFGSNLDQTHLAPEQVMGSAIIDIPRSILTLARELKEGTFEPTPRVFGLASGVVRYIANPALEGRLSDSAKAVVRDTERAIIDGRLKIADREAAGVHP
jgi:basic membrane lipoprotein Med (substrate-binding protein (PBP1-ABC) superfamily)